MTDRAGMEFLGAERIEGSTFFEIENLHYRDEHGGMHVRSVVRHPGAVVVVPVRDNEIIMIRQYRAAVDADVLELPAGKLDVAGEPPAQAAIRECAEEIGLLPARVEHLVTFRNSPGFTDETTHVFAATDMTEVDRTPIGPEEVASVVESVPVAEAAVMIHDGRIDDAKSIIGIMAYLHPHEDIG